MSCASRFRWQPITAKRAGQRGFTLVELMISMVLGLFIVLALVTLLINVTRGNSELSKTNRIIENGRFAMQMLQGDLSHAGYWGSFIPQFDDLTLSGAPADVPADLGLVTAVPDPCVDWTTITAALPTYKSNLIGISVQAYEIPAVVPSPTLSVCASKVVNPQPSTDVLIVRHLETCLPGVDGCAALTANELYLQVARCGTAVPSPAYALEKYNLANVNTLFPLKVRSADCATAAYAEKRKFVSSLYYVRRYAVTDGDNLPTLMRRQFSCASGTCEYGAEEALVEGVERFRVELGIDNVSDSGEAVDPSAAVNWASATVRSSPRNRGDGNPDAYVHCTTAAPCSAATLMNAVVAKLYLLMRSEKTTAGYTDSKIYNMGTAVVPAFGDGYKRHLFTDTVRLVNVSARRETP